MTWQFHGLKYSGDEREEKKIWLYPELDFSAMLDEYYDETGRRQLSAYVEFIRYQKPEWWKADAVPIYWAVLPVQEHAPFQEMRYRRLAMRMPQHAEHVDDNFLSYYSWPVDSKTGKPLNWYALPVRNDRFPKFVKALNWTPSPLQPHCPLRSIIESQSGQSPRLARWRKAAW